MTFIVHHVPYAAMDAALSIWAIASAVETNSNLGSGGGGSSLTYVLSVPNGAIWFFLASSAEVTPAVDPAGFIAPLFFPSLLYVTCVRFVESER